MSTLSKLLSSGARAELFRLLFGLNRQELHVRDLGRQAGFSVSTVRQELKNLESLGLVQTRVSGNRTYYRGNTAHPLYQEIRSLVLKTSGLADVIHKALGTESIRVAFVFGSLASGSETSESDIDLLVIGEGEETFYELCDYFLREGILPTQINGTAFMANNQIVFTNEQFL